ncbi:XdhC family protein [Mycobacterium nebraskense]|uniref:Carbon monoxide dehydrogenase n=1 Tax=Mycobacterium nebraskense TaxID=244292 RepID=A0A1X1Z2Q1_9MYCO|nr:XdhC family protein [Mycobacterium nebraskense]MBI2694667.1 XdhC family protein [Mycobacterium nebraskense]MCV7117532.1 XdhC family protein [Mycobacterium nebraskense]ORW17623.1 carbon monoxide dehydrogenase [Mycobacterium nebraskense]
MSVISERAQQLLAARTPFVRATVVRAQPPASAYPGDEAILLADGTIEGFVGGQCAQNSVRKAALGALQTNESVLLRVLPDGDVHFPEAPGACVVVNPCLSGGSLEIFLTPQLPPPMIRIYGATPIADALTQICGVLGYEVSRDADMADTTAFPTAIVIASHGGPEAEIIRTALDNGVGYIGLVASKIRGAAILNEIELSDAERARIHTPVGLNIGAKTPAEIAVSIAAELVAGVRGGLGRAVVPERGPLEAIDPVCGMTVPIGPAAEHLRRAGTDYWFCGPGCRTAFAGKAGA